MLARLYAAARLHVNLFQPSFELRERTRVGARATKRRHPPATPADRALAGGALGADGAARIADLRARGRPGGRARPTIRSARAELGRRVDRHGSAPVEPRAPIALDVAALLNCSAAQEGERRTIHRRALQAREADPQAPVDAG